MPLPRPTATFHRLFCSYHAKLANLASAAEAHTLKNTNKKHVALFIMSLCDVCHLMSLLLPVSRCHWCRVAVDSTKSCMRHERNSTDITSSVNLFFHTLYFKVYVRATFVTFRMRRYSLGHSVTLCRGLLVKMHM